MPTANQKGDAQLKELESLLTEMANDGDVDFSAPSHLPPQDLVVSELFWKLTAMRERLLAAATGARSSSLGFSEIIKKVRSDAGLTLEDVALAVKISVHDLRKMETDSVVVVTLPLEAVTSLLEAFGITVHVLESSVRLGHSKESMSSPSARSTSPGVIDERVMGDIANFLAQRAARSGAADVIPRGFINGVRDRLKRIGREDLLE